MLLLLRPGPHGGLTPHSRQESDLLSKLRPRDVSGGRFIGPCEWEGGSDFGC